MGCSPRTHFLQGRSSPFADGSETLRGNTRLGVTAGKIQDPLARAERTQRGARPDEPCPSLAAPASSGSAGEPPLPFLQHGIIAAHRAAGVIAAGLGARAAPACSPPGRGENAICPLLSPRNEGVGRRDPHSSAHVAPQAGASGEGGDGGTGAAPRCSKAPSLCPTALIPGGCLAKPSGFQLQRPPERFKSVL